MPPAVAEVYTIAVLQHLQRGRNPRCRRPRPLPSPACLPAPPSAPGSPPSAAGKLSGAAGRQSLRVCCGAWWKTIPHRYSVWRRVKVDHSISILVPPFDPADVFAPSYAAEGQAPEAAPAFVG